MENNAYQTQDLSIEQAGKLIGAAVLTAINEAHESNHFQNGNNEERPRRRRRRRNQDGSEDGREGNGPGNENERRNGTS